MSDPRSIPPRVKVSLEVIETFHYMLSPDTSITEGEMWKPVEPPDPEISDSVKSLFLWALHVVNQYLLEDDEEYDEEYEDEELEDDEDENDDDAERDKVKEEEEEAIIYTAKINLDLVPKEEEEEEEKE